MGLLEALEATLKFANQIEVKGETNIAALAAVISNLKGLVNAVSQIKPEVQIKDEPEDE